MAALFGGCKDLKPTGSTMGLKQKVRVVTVRFSCFNARKLYQIGVNNGGVFNA